MSPDRTSTSARAQDTSDRGGAIEAPVLRVLDQFDPSRAPGTWVCRELGQGEQGRIYSARGREDRGDGALVIKLYDERKSWAHQGARDQYDALRLLREVVDGTSLHGWTIRSPAPLFRCERPLALVMTQVSGVPLSRLLGGAGAVTGEVFESMPTAVAAALQLFWSAGRRVYGEINLDNVLCDLPGRRLSFIDPGIARPARLCLEQKGPWYPASHDLSYLLYAVSSATVKACALRPGLRARQLDMTARVLCAACERLAPGGDREQLLSEIGACTEVHLSRIRVSWGPAGAWRRLVRRSARRGIARVIDGARRSCPQNAAVRSEGCERPESEPIPDESPMPVLRH